MAFCSPYMWLKPVAIGPNDHVALCLEIETVKIMTRDRTILVAPSAVDREMNA